MIESACQKTSNIRIFLLEFRNGQVCDELPRSFGRLITDARVYVACGEVNWVGLLVALVLCKASGVGANYDGNDRGAFRELFLEGFQV
jgi:hypothetical protein